MHSQNYVASQAHLTPDVSQPVCSRARGSEVTAWSAPAWRWPWACLRPRLELRALLDASTVQPLGNQIRDSPGSPDCRGTLKETGQATAVNGGYVFKTPLASGPGPGVVSSLESGQARAGGGSLPGPTPSQDASSSGQASCGSSLKLSHAVGAQGLAGPPAPKHTMTVLSLCLPFPWAFLQSLKDVGILRSSFQRRQLRIRERERERLI